MWRGLSVSASSGAADAFAVRDLLLSSSLVSVFWTKNDARFKTFVHVLKTDVK